MSPLLQSPLTIEHALLGFLRQSPMHGYEIFQRMSDPKGLGLVWHIKQSHLYALLTRLEKEGLVHVIIELQGARPPRKVFHLTAAGERAFLTWVQLAVERGRDLRLDFLVKFYFAQQEGKEVVLHLINQQRMACLDWIGRQQAITGSSDDEQMYEGLISQFRTGQIEAMLNWLDSCEQAVMAGSLVS